MKFLGLALVLVVLTARAEKLDKNAQEALEQTMGLLRSSQKRTEEINKDPKAKAANAQVESLTGNAANTQKLYELAALIMQNLAQQSAGDPDKMVKILEQAQKDPTGFAKSFTPEQKKLLQQLAGDIEKTKASKPVP